MIRPLRPADHADWTRLWRGYLTFYRTELPEERYAATWGRLMQGEGLYGLAAEQEGQLVGIAHYLFHPSTWVDEVCYLQDLFVDVGCRGGGIGRRLIEAVAEAARERGVGRFYWLTHHENRTARWLYDSLAEHRGHIRYDFPL